MSRSTLRAQHTTKGAMSMAMKKPMARRPAVPTKRTTTSTNLATPLVAVEESNEVAVPAPTARRARKPVVPGRVAPPIELIKDVVTSDTEEGGQGKNSEEQQYESKQDESTEASKPLATTERKSPPARPRPTSTRQDDFAKTARLSDKEMRAMSLEERYKLFRSLNTKTEAYYPLLKDIPKKLVMRMDEAIERGIIGDKPRAKGASAVHYCGYCVDWQPFHVHTWTGYTKCCGCGISTMDFYTRADNNLFGV